MPRSHRSHARPGSLDRSRMTRRGKVLAAFATVGVVSCGTLGYFALFPERAPAFVRTTLDKVGLGDDRVAAAPTCPLTGEPPRGAVPERPALAIKVENAPESRPQAALNQADVVVEEPVEGGYTRFIAIYQCGGSDRVGPVRSGRTTDPDYLRQYGEAVFGYAGGVSSVKREVPEAGLVDVNYILAAEAYTRDPSRAAPHDLYTTTAALWDAGRAATETPSPVFTYSDAWEERQRKLSAAHLPFSAVSDVWWNWSRGAGAWVRSHGETRHMLEDGDQVSAANVVIQVVDVTASGITDAAGNFSPRIELTGSGKAYVLRDGKVIAGRWERARLDDLTVFTARDGTEIALAPGRTWVELVPTTIALELTR
jgi:hypothetical protein